MTVTQERVGEMEAVQLEALLEIIVMAMGTDRRMSRRGGALQ